MSFNIIDREDESKEIINKIHESIDTPVFILVSKAGIGKHSLTTKICNLLQEQYTLLRVRTEQKNTDENNIKGSFFHEITLNTYRRFNSTKKEENIKKNKLSLHSFIKTTKKYRKYIANSIIELFKAQEKSKFGILSLGTIIFLNKFYAIDFYDIEKILQERNVNSLDIGEAYMDFIFSQRNILFNVDNVQNIDTESFYRLKRILNNNRKNHCCFILEYTVNDKYSESIRFKEDLELDYSSVYILNISALRVEHAMEIVTLEKNNLEEEYLNRIKCFYAKDNTGNIRALQDFVYTLEKNTMLEINPTENHFKELTKTELYIVCVIAIHNGNIRNDLLDYFVENIPSTINSELSQVYEDLIVFRKLLTNDAEHTFFAHASIFSSWNDFIRSNKPESIFIAAMLCYDYYLDEIQNDEVQNNEYRTVNAILIILRIITDYLPKNILYVSKYLHIIAAEFTDTQTIWKYIYLLLDTIDEERERFISIYYDIIDLCCDLELYSNMKEIWEKIRPYVFKFEQNECDQANFYYCKIHFLCGEQEVVISFANEKLKQSISSKSILYYKMYLITAYRSINLYKEMQMVVDSINANIEMYKLLPIYGYYLRLAEVYKSRTEAVSDVENSVLFFQSIPNMQLQAAKSKISLSFLYSIQGYMEDAENKITEASCFFDNKFRHIIKNNLAVIKLLKNDFSADTYALLQDAQFSASGLFSVIAIHNNSMIWLYEQSKFYELKQLVHLVERLIGKLEDKHLLAITAYNISVFARENNIIKSREYFNLAYKYKEHCSTLEKRLLNIEPTNQVERFLLSKEWHIAMLSFWEMDYI